MESKIGDEVRIRSASCGGDKMEEIGAESIQFGEEIQTLIMAPAETGGSSFTALLELPANQAVKLLHSPGKERKAEAPYLCAPPCFPADVALIERASKYSVFAAAMETSPSSVSVKEEPAESDSQPNSSLVVSDAVVTTKSTKRKDREKKVKPSARKSKTIANDSSEKLPYVHVRARRGQATDSHSLAERARREKINARMKLLQELVPGCNKISGTAMVLDEIINHVQSLQRQVEFLSMRLAAVNPRIDINFESLFAAESESLMDCNIPGMVMPSMWMDGQLNGNRQPYQQLWHFDGIHQPVWGRDEGNPNLITPENSLLSYDSSANSASLHSNHPLKMEL